MLQLQEPRMDKAAKKLEHALFFLPVSFFSFLFCNDNNGLPHRNDQDTLKIQRRNRSKRGRALAPQQTLIEDMSFPPLYLIQTSFGKQAF